MNVDLLLALAGFAFVTSATPGPNNMMLMASGANFGMRRTIPHMLGVSLGFGLMVVVLGLGVDRLIAQSEILAQGLKWLSLVYMAWLAWKIATALPPELADDDRTKEPLTFLQGAAFQWVNPKAWAMALGALSAFAAGLGGAVVVAAVFAAVNLPAVSAWVALGLGMRRVLSTSRRFRIFNLLMAVLLVLSMLPVMSG